MKRLLLATALGAGVTVALADAKIIDCMKPNHGDDIIKVERFKTLFEPIFRGAPAEDAYLVKICNIKFNGVGRPDFLKLFSISKGEVDNHTVVQVAFHALVLSGALQSAPASREPEEDAQ